MPYQRSFLKHKEKNSFLLESDVLSKIENEYFESVKAGMNSAVAADAINTLVNFLSWYYGRKVIILLDEYDMPMQEAWLSGYWDEAVAFFRSFFNAAFKTNPYMERGLITGILLKPEIDAPSPLGSKKPRQVDEAGFPAKLEKTSLSSQCQSIFSDLNNLEVITTTSEKYLSEILICIIHAVNTTAKLYGIGIIIHCHRRKGYTCFYIHADGVIDGSAF